jgi:hypothetical protein
VRRILPALPWLLLALAIVDWLGLKGGVIRHPTWVLGILVALATLALATRAVAVSRELRNPRRGRAGFVGELLLMAGVLTALGGGLANWLLSLQGYVVLHEGESVPLHGGSHLQQFDSGPLSRIEELHLTLGLAELKLIPTGDELFYPESRLTVRHGEEQSVELAISPGDAGSFGALRFYQGAFGFAPGIVIERDDRTVFDRIVPFVTERHGPTGISFIGSFTIASEELEVDGAVDLGSLDAGLRGHATLRLEVSRAGRLLGRGTLTPGRFAEIDESFRVGFTDLKRWSEIDISRRNYGGVVKTGAAVSLLGAIVWPFGRWRAR